MTLIYRLLTIGLLLVGTACSTLPSEPDVVDTERVSAIERAARDNGTQVIWLRYPTRPADPQPR